MSDSAGSILLDPEQPLGDDVDLCVVRFARGPKGLRMFVAEERCYIRVRLKLADPLRFPTRYISVVGDRDREICLFDSLAGLEEASRLLVQEELSRFYVIPNVRRVRDLSTKYGPLYWRVDTDQGPREFVVKWNSENVLTMPDGHLRLTDVDGNRFAVPAPEQLDAESRKRVELLR